MDGGDGDLRVAVRHLDGKGGGGRKVLRVRLGRRSGKPDRTEEWLTIRLTDDEDPFFFYSLVLTETDFQTLKRQQNLLVDFGAFPSSIRDLSERCGDGEGTFSLVLKPSGEGSTDALLNFQETNPFRELCHLSLKMCKGTDKQVKEYLVECIKHLQDRGQEEGGRIRRLEEELGETREWLNEKSREAEKLQQLANEQSSGFGAKLAEKVAREKERAVVVAAEAQERHDQERREMQESHAKIVRQMENRIAALDYENKDLLERRHKNEAAIQRQNERLRSATEEAARAKEGLQSHRSELGKVEVELSRAEREISRLSQDVAILKAELSSQKDLAVAFGDQKARLEADLDDKCSLVTKRENAVRNVSKELVKANEVIRKFMDQSKAEHQKAKQAVKVAEEQEKLLADKDKELDSVRQELKKSSEAVSEARNQAEEASTRLRRSEEERSGLEKRVRTSETVIDWLNRQLTQAQRRDPGLRLAAPPDGLATFSSALISAASTPLDARTGASGRSAGTSHQRQQQQESLQFRDKENNPTGLDEKYLQSNDSATQGQRHQNGSVLPSNVMRGQGKGGRGGLLRKTPPAAPSSRTKSMGASEPTSARETESVYFPKT